MPYEIDESKSFELLPDGEYEAHIASVEKKLSKTGKEMLAVTFEIRKDVSQPGQGRLVFDNIMKDKDDPEYFDKDKVQCIIRTQPQHPKTFQNEDMAIQYINGIDLIIKLTHTDGSDGYEPKNKINGKFAFKPSKVGTRYNPNVRAQPVAAAPTAVASAPTANESTVLPIAEEDLPF